MDVFGLFWFGSCFGFGVYGQKVKVGGKLRCLSLFMGSLLATASGREHHHFSVC